MEINERLTYTNAAGERIVMDQIDSPFFIEDAAGLNGLKNSVFTARTAGQDGATVTGCALEMRNITLTGAITENEAANRAAMIRVFTPKQRGVLTYEYLDVRRAIDCEVEVLPTIAPSSDGYLRFFISLLCANPYWRDQNETRVDVAAWMPLLEFDDLEIPAEGIAVEERSPSLLVNVINAGHVPAGMRVVFRASGTLTNPSIQNIATYEQIKLNVTMLAGDEITVTTGYRNKKVTRRRGGVLSNLFSALDMGSTFIQLASGDNVLRYAADTNVDALTVSVFHGNAYLGV